ncbi:MAG TPA: hypothetical protein VJ927_08280 [Actinomycetota bacterium]|nr:hypothetical protein [Actinomycetota bacterium]
MAGGGLQLSRSEARARRQAIGAKETRERSHASARLGLTLRSVLLAPGSGFAAAFATAERRARAGRRPVEGLAPFVLAALGGAATALLWLKVGALMGVREVCSATYLTGYIVAAGVLGALFALLAQSLWGFMGPRVVTMLRGQTPAPHGFRLIWGASAFPQVFALALLLPLDLLIVGRDTFTTAELVDPVSTAWAAFSIAIGFSALIWSLYLLLRGVQIGSGLGGWKSLVGAASALVSFLFVVGAFVALTLLLPQGASCPT